MDKFAFGKTQNTMPDLQDFLTPAQAAKELEFTVVSVRNLIYKKKLESIRFGRAVLIPKKAVAEYKKKTEGLGKNDPRRSLK